MIFRIYSNFCNLNYGSVFTMTCGIVTQNDSMPNGRIRFLTRNAADTVRDSSLAVDESLSIVEVPEGSG